MVYIKYEPQNSRAAAYDDGEFVGECDYLESDGVWTITHTCVNDDHQGQGIAGKLVKCVAEQARMNFASVFPVCSYAVTWFDRHPDYADVLSDR